MSASSDFKGFSARPLDAGINRLNEQLVIMGAYVEQALEHATAAWRTRNLSRCRSVYELEEKVNRSHREVDALCVELLATQSPMAADLRTIVAVIKVNSDLERMVDLAVNIANNTEYYLKGAAQVPMQDLSEMSDEVRVMVREVLDAWVRRDETRARRVLGRDDAVDAYKRKILSEMMTFVKNSSAATEQGLNVILMAKNLERIGDHATNIAEDVIFSASGEDVRHSGRASNGSPEAHGERNKDDKPGDSKW